RASPPRSEQLPCSDQRSRAVPRLAVATTAKLTSPNSNVVEAGHEPAAIRVHHFGPRFMLLAGGDLLAPQGDYCRICLFHANERHRKRLLDEVILSQRAR